MLRAIFVTALHTGQQKHFKSPSFSSFMNFIYHNVSNVISVAFLIFVEDSRANGITVVIFYFVFLALFTSFSQLFCLSSICFLQQPLKFVITFFILTIMLCAIVLVCYIYFRTYKPNRLGEVATGLIPSIALSSISWTFKRKLQSITCLHQKLV